MAVKTLDALVLASLPEEVQVRRIAALWCRAFRDRCPHSKVEVVDWVKAEFGPVIDADRREQIALKLIDETRRQVRLRKRRRDRQAAWDPLVETALAEWKSHGARLARLLNSRLGPARFWVSGRPTTYIDGYVHSGIVAGLIPTTLRVGCIEYPNLLVYHQRGDEARSYYVPGWVTTVEDAFIWVIPEAAREFLELEDTRVEHDGESQAVRLITRFGTKVLPWKSLLSSP